MRITWKPSEKLMERCRTIHILRENGVTNQKIAEELGICLTYVYGLKKWYKRYLKRQQKLAINDPVGKF